MAYRFLDFKLDVERRDLLEHGEPKLIAPKAFDVLSYLIQNNDRMVSKAELMDQFWSRNTTEAALQKTISELRKIVGNKSTGQRLIKTYYGRGFRFLAPVQLVARSVPAGGPGEVEASVTINEKRLATVLSIKLPASITQTSDHDDDEEQANHYMNLARTHLENFEGILLHTLLDGFTAGFGLDLRYEDGARRAVHCAYGLAKAKDFDINCGFGIATGVLSNHNGDWTLPSDVERTATRLAETAQPNNILLSDTTCEQLQEEVETVPFQKGRRVVSLEPMGAGVPGRPHKNPTKFVGRSAELAFLLAHSERVAVEGGRAVQISGPPGIGKTRLVAEFLEHVDAGSSTSICVQCLPALNNTPLASISELVSALKRCVHPDVMIAEADIALINGLQSNIGNSPQSLSDLSDQQRKMRVCGIVSEMLIAASHKKPIVLVLEDVHWLDASSREYLETVLPAVEGSSTLVILTTRLVAGQPLTETILNLSPLSRHDSLALLQEIYGGDQIEGITAEKLIKRADGNPFFIEELALAAQCGGNPTTELPTTVQAVIGVRIGALTNHLRTLVYIVSVIGPPAPLDLIAHIAKRSPSRTQTEIQQLIQMGFLRRDTEGCSFRHMLINDTAYEMIAHQDRRRLHAEVAQELERRREITEVLPERLAWHHQESGATGKAIPYWLAAGRAAIQHSAQREAVGFSQNGLALLSHETATDNQSELQLLLCLAPALTALRGFGFEGVGATYKRAEVLNATVNNTKAETRILVGLWIHTWVSGALSESLTYADKLVALAERNSNPSLTLQGHASRGQVLLHLGRLDTALAHLKQGLIAIKNAAPKSLSAQSAAVSCAAYASWVARMMGHRDEALKFLAQSKALSLLKQNPYADAIHHALCTETFMFDADHKRCLAYADTAIALSREHGFDFWLGTGLVMRGWALGQQGFFEPAFSTLEEGITVFEATGAGVQLANWHGLKAETLLAAGRYEATVESAEHALACAGRAEDFYFTPRIHTVAALAKHQLGDPENGAVHQEAAKRLMNDFGIAQSVLDLQTSGPASKETANDF